MLLVDYFSLPVAQSCSFISVTIFLIIGMQLQLFQSGFECDIDVDQGDTMNRKIRNAQLAQYNFILVLGEKELTNKTVNVRTRDNKVDKFIGDNYSEIW